MSLSAYSTSTAERTLILRGQFPLVREDSPQVWIDVAMEGSWQGHSSGPFELTRESFEQIVANFESQKNAMLLDYEHASEATYYAPAAGWVHKLEVREGSDGLAHLWALAELTDRAAAHVKAGEYRFSSGVFVFDTIDRVTGESVGCSMHSLALTGVPFIDGQQPIALSQRASRAALSHGDAMTFSKEALLAALEMLEKEEISMAELEAAAHMAAAKDGALEPEEAAAKSEDKPEDKGKPTGELQPDPKKEKPLSDEQPEAVAASLPVATGQPEEEPVQTAEQPQDAAQMAMSLLMGLLGTQDPAQALAWLEEHRADLEAMVGGGQEAAPLSDVAALSRRLDASSATIKSLSDRLKAYEEREAAAQKKAEEDRLAKVDAEVDALVQQGYLLSTGKASLVKLALSDRPAYDSLVSSLKPIVPTGRHASATASPKQNTAHPSQEDDPVVVQYALSLRGLKVNGKELSEDERLARARERVAELKQQLGRN